jgi:hypothetical protein
MVLMAVMAHQELQVRKVFKELQGHQGNQEYLVFLELQVHKVLQVPQVLLVLQVPVAVGDFLVSAAEKFHWDPVMTV